MLNEKRQSNFELLRIVAIIMIIMHHYLTHGDIQIKDNITFNIILSKILNFGKLANHIFILLTGYFMIKSKVNYRKVINLILEMFFYSITIFGIFYFFGIVKLNLKDFIYSFFPIIWGNWFLIYYILLYLLIPYINLFIEKINKNQFKKIIIILVFIYSVIPTFTQNAWGYTAHNIFILDYLIGAYIRIYPIEKLNNNNFNFKFLTIISILGIMSIFAFILLGKILNISKLIKNSNYLLTDNYSILALLIAIFLLLIFKNIKIYSKKINYIASSVLGIYLIHDNFIVRQWFWKIFWPNTDYISSNFFILHMICKVFLVFMVCLIIDKMRILFFKKAEDWLSDKIFSILIKFKRLFSRIEEKICL